MADSSKGWRVKLDPIFTRFRTGELITSACNLAFTQLGDGEPPADGAFELQFFVRVAEVMRKGPGFGSPEPFAKLTGTLGNASTRTPTLTFEGSPESELSEVFEAEGHRRPRRRILLNVPREDGAFDSHPLLLPDVTHAERCFAEVSVALSVDGAVQAPPEKNDTLDLLLLPFALTHAVFHFVDDRNQTLANARAVVLAEDGAEIEVEADDFGEVYLPAPNQEVFRFSRLVVEGERALGPIASRLSSRRRATA